MDGHWFDEIERQLAHLRLESARAVQGSAAAREGAAEAKLKIWLEKLTALETYASRDLALELALEAATAVLSADFANVQRIHPSGRGLVLEAHRGFGQSFLNFFEFVEDRHSACGLALQEHRPVIVEDVISSPIFANTRGLEELQLAGVRSVRSVPLVGSSGQVLGMLSVHWHRPRAHSDAELKRLQALAGAIARLFGR